MSIHLESLSVFYLPIFERLGVGASLTEGHQNLTRETARLRGKLVDSKHRRKEGGLVAEPAKPTTDSDEESKLIAIKKRARTDPFDIVYGKKKKTRVETVNGTKSSAPPSVQGGIIRTQTLPSSSRPKKRADEKDEIRVPRLVAESLEPVFPSPENGNVPSHVIPSKPVSSSPQPKLGKCGLFLTAVNFQKYFSR